MANLLMHRREALQKLAILLGGTLSLPAQAALLGEKINSIAIDIPTDQQELISELADVIMPETENPGAKKAGVGKFIVRVIQDCTAKEEQDKFLQGLQKINTLSQTTYSKSFNKLDRTQQNEIMGKIARQENDFFKGLRELTVVGFFTSQIGATQVLQYLPVPGKFQGDIPLEPSQRTWSL
ncbi:gluconate 2-dehydrogenase subunit 3 family protein [Rhodocytophaga rosea]|uniref:Gluconate 2-dehydrogenase subunit 3 family protein n=1 Tax=Rhodocytophaga rosea TaxID=2704465 RepID=A0A6C0GTN0_9BACT|nr:gluconate 2-dehydrogenase subunit 3 family protein [Rhodocytophaga rosea]QHT71519.1 gluconate 2-dehydrogenase subunit 3 family protein [Rhodocytophaga rosea]